MSEPRTVRAPRGTQLTCKSWQTEAVYRMIQNNLDPEVAERPRGSGGLWWPWKSSPLLGSF